ncbi:MAG: helix-turn-helix domain-containing protein [Patescibacteria group bacterium]
MNNPLENRITIDLLTSLGLPKSSVRCYVSSLALGPSSVSAIAKRAAMNRVDAYGAIKRLVDAGLVEQEVKSHGRKIHPQPLDTLRRLAENHQKQAARLRWKIENLIPSLLPFTATNEERPEVMLFEGKDAALTITERSLRTKPGSTIMEIRPQEEYEFFGTPQNYDEEIYIPTRIEKNIAIRVLAPYEWFQKMHHLDHEQLRETRVLPKGWEIASETFIYDDEVGLLWKYTEPTGVVIKSQKIAMLMRLLFEAAWRQAENDHEEAALRSSSTPSSKILGKPL